MTYKDKIYEEFNLSETSDSFPEWLIKRSESDHKKSVQMAGDLERKFASPCGGCSTMSAPIAVVNMNKEAATKFIERHIPILIRNRNGKGQFPHVSINAQKKVVEHLSEALVKYNVVLDPDVHPFCICDNHKYSETEKCTEYEKRLPLF